ncbi:hypothetical protein [Brevibacillus parabrevis]|uniref:hypothetical protein n=1 Tax=Brevibacillus parabrevis TaxID=54914 RepID=UPI0036F212B5
MKFLVNNYWATPSQNTPQAQQPAVNDWQNTKSLNAPIDKQGRTIKLGDRVRFSFFYGEVKKCQLQMKIPHYLHLNFPHNRQ